MVNRMRHTHSHTGHRRSHHALQALVLVPCARCKELKLPQFVCSNCGTHKERHVVDVLKKLDKKERKRKEKELAEREAEKPMDAEALSKH